MGRVDDLKTRSSRKDNGSSKGRKKAERTSTRQLSLDTVQTAGRKTGSRLLSINRTIKSGHNSRRRVNYCRNFNRTMKSGHRNYSTVKTDGGGLGRSSDGRCTLDCLSGALTRPLGAAFVGDSVKLALFAQNKVNMLYFNLGALV